MHALYVIWLGVFMQSSVNSNRYIIERWAKNSDVCWNKKGRYKNVHNYDLYQVWNAILKIECYLAFFLLQKAKYETGPIFLSL